MIRMQFASAPGQPPENHLFRDCKRLGLSAAFLNSAFPEFVKEAAVSVASPGILMVTASESLH